MTQKIYPNQERDTNAAIRKNLTKFKRKIYR